MGWCVKYIHNYKCDDYWKSGTMKCAECAFRLRNLVEIDSVTKIINESENKEEMLNKLSKIPTVSTEYLNMVGIEKLEGGK